MHNLTLNFIFSNLGWLGWKDDETEAKHI